MPTINVEKDTLAKAEVLGDLEDLVHTLMEAHEAKRILWFPSELLAPGRTRMISPVESCSSGISSVASPCTRTVVFGSSFAS